MKVGPQKISLNNGTGIQWILIKELIVLMAPYLLVIGLVAFVLSSIVLLGAYEAKNSKPYYESTISKITNINFSSILDITIHGKSAPKKIYLELDEDDMSYVRQLTEKKLFEGGPKILTLNANVRYQEKRFLARVDLAETKVIDLADPEKWVYQIEILNATGEGDINVMSNFQLLSTQQDDNLSNYLGLRLLQKRGFQSIEGHYADLNLNGESKGLYYLQEFKHPSTALLARLGENGVLFEIDAKGRIAKTMIGNQAALQGLRTQWDACIFGEKSIESLFDIQYLGRLLAIWDLAFRTTPNLSEWLFYYDGASNSVTPIVKAISLGSDDQTIGFSSLMEQPCVVEDSLQGDGVIINKLMNSLSFQRHYIQEATQLSEVQFLDQFLYDERRGISKLMKSKRVSPRSMKEDPIAIQVLYASAKYLRYILFPDRIEVSAYLDQIGKDHLTLQIENHQCLPLLIHGLQIRDSIKFIPEKEYVLEGRCKAQGKSNLYHFKIPKTTVWGDSLIPELTLEYGIVGLNDSNRTVLVYPFSSDAYAGMMKNPIARESTYASFRFIREEEGGNVLRIPKGKWKISRDLVVPRQRSLEIDPGVELDLLNSSKIISYSPIYSRGSASHPIVFTSSDSSGQGLILIGVEQKSILQNTNFEYLSCFNNSGYELTGAVTFYESPVHISSCTFANNQIGDDYLNIIRTDFSIDGSTFVNVLADAVDADYCRGTISNSKFIKIGNDCVDVSGSELIVNCLTMRSVGDKGLSAGENSTVDAEDLDIFDAEIALTSKDRSKMFVREARLHNSRIGIAVYQKKTEFGPAYLMAENLAIEYSELPFLLEDLSELIVDGQSIEPNKENVRAILYGIEYGKSSKSR